MKTLQEIAVARHMVSAHDANFKVSPFQRASLHGMRCALAMARFSLPADKLAWLLFFQHICERHDPVEYKEWSPHHAKLTISQDKTALDWKLMRDICAQVEKENVVPELHRGILVGFRLACAWVLELPQGWVLQQLWNGSVTDAAVGTTSSDRPGGFNLGVV